VCCSACEVRDLIESEIVSYPVQGFFFELSIVWSVNVVGSAEGG